MNKNVSDFTLKLVKKATEYAVKSGYDVILIDHLVVTILKNKTTIDFFNDIRLSAVEISSKLDKLITENAPHSSKRIRDMMEKGFVPEVSLQLNALVSDVHGTVVSNNRNTNTIDISDYILALLTKEYQSYFNSIFNLPANRQDKERIIKALSENSETREDEDGTVTNLTQMAIDGKIDPVIGREEDIHYISEVLSKKKKNNVMLLGKPGVGKTVLAEGLALAIAERTTHPTLFDKRIYMIDVASMVAGTKFRGDFEEKAKNIISKLAEDSNAILFIDEIHTVMGAGASGSSGGLDLANIMKPYLARGDLMCIGATTLDEYKSVVEKDKAMMRRFSNYIIDETNKPETLAIMNGLLDTYASYHDVEYPSDILESIYDLSHKYIQNRANPDKSIDIMDSVGAYCKINNIDTVCMDTVRKIVSKISKVPVDAMEDDDKSDNYGELGNNIKKKLFGQDHVIDKITEQIMVAKAGLVEDNKPMGSFLLVGTSGTGKTHMARQIAENLKIPLIKYDMSEYMEKHSVAKLLGAPPGYAGYDDNSAGLVDDIEQNPNCVLLIDEIEKAHPQVLDIFLQVMDDATLKSSQGKVVKFNNVVIIMTSNAGARANNENIMGFTKSNNKASSEMMKAVKNQFRPEFINRLDGVLQFNNLTEVDVIRIVEGEIRLLNDMIVQHNLRLNISDSAKRYIANKGFDPKMGARPIKRVIADEIKKPLALKIVKGEIKPNTDVKVTIKNDEVVFIYSK